MFTLFAAASLFTTILACPQHDNSGFKLGKRASTTKDWAYDASYDWGMINEEYTLCQTGTQQSPIGLNTTSGYSTSHTPTFDYSTPVAGSIYNWGYGPAFSPSANSTDLSGNPSLSYDGTTVYLKGWHVHSPADHTIDGRRSRAELHLVHATAEGKEAAVVAIRIDPVSFNSTSTSKFFSSFPTAPSYTNDTTIPSTVDMAQALTEAGTLKEFWSYSGSLTSPPCTEGLRWFVAGEVMQLGTAQMQSLLEISTYGARVEQEIWGQGVNV